MPGGLDVVNRRNYYLQVGKRKRKPSIDSSGTALRPHRNGNGTPRRGTLQCCTGLVEEGVGQPEKQGPSYVRIPWRGCTSI